MLLGKRPRPSIIRRTTSMTRITVDVDVDIERSDHPALNNPFNQEAQDLNYNNTIFGSNGLYDQRFLSMVSPRPTNRRSNSGDFMETPHFLRTCGLCNRPLGPGRDTYMYRGDTAFCSLECREKQMKHDERKDKCKTGSKKQETFEGSSSSHSQSHSKASFP